VHPLGHSVSAAGGSIDPLGAGPSTPVSPTVNGYSSASTMDPLGMGRPGAFMSASVRVQPTRPRLDAREAASKLANMF
jgi:hypothetical protein